MIERLFLRKRLMKASAAAFILAGCTHASESNPPELKIPNVNAPIIQDDVEGQPNAYAFAYGIGLSAGCNPEQLLEGNELKKNTLGEETYLQTLQAHPEEINEIDEGLRAGIDRGLAERGNRSDVC